MRLSSGTEALFLVCLELSVKYSKLIFGSLGDKSNHTPSFHVPQLYYFISFATIMGWPALVTNKDGVVGLVKGVWDRMFGSTRYMRRARGCIMLTK